MSGQQETDGEPQGQPSKLKVFISSTYHDLIPEREAVEEALRVLRFKGTGMELFGSRPDRPKDVCLDELARCHIYVAIIGGRYGSIDEETGLSYTELEFRRASRPSDYKYPLAYLKAEDAILNDKDHREVDEAAQLKLRAFIQHIKKTVTVTTFRESAGLILAVQRDVQRVAREILRKRGLEPSSIRAVRGRPTRSQGGVSISGKRVEVLGDVIGRDKVAVTVKTGGKAVKMAPPRGTIGQDPTLLKRVEDLIEKLAQYRIERLGRDNAGSIIRKIGGDFKKAFKIPKQVSRAWLPIERAPEAIAWLEDLINNTQHGRIRKARQRQPSRGTLMGEQAKLLRVLEWDEERMRGELRLRFGVASRSQLGLPELQQWVYFLEREVKQLYGE